MNKNLVEPTTHITARRRLVRGVFAAPAALSLYSGGALAAASISCVAKDVSTNSFPTGTMSNTTDTYIRVQLWNLTSGGNNTAWVKGAELTTWQAPTATLAPFLSATQWQCFSKTGTSAFTPGQIIAQDPAEIGYLLQHNGAWVALKIDSIGNIKGVVGIGANTTGASAVHQSCWTSFRKV